MICLSVRQPWANMIAAREKTIEVRTWRTHYRGELGIVSSRRPHIPPAGFLLAVAVLRDCSPMTLGDEAAARCPLYPGAWSWILGDIRPVLPVAVRGQLGLYERSFEDVDLIFEPVAGMLI